MRMCFTGTATVWTVVLRQGAAAAAQVIRGFQSAAAEMWMLGLTDYQVITTHSGYGRLGSFMSGKYHQVGVLPRPLAGAA